MRVLRAQNTAVGRRPPLNLSGTGSTVSRAATRATTARGPRDETPRRAEGSSGPGEQGGIVRFERPLRVGARATKRERGGASGFRLRLDGSTRASDALGHPSLAFRARAGLPASGPLRTLDGGSACSMRTSAGKPAEIGTPARRRAPLAREAHARTDHKYHNM